MNQPTGLVVTIVPGVLAVTGLADPIVLALNDTTVPGETIAISAGAAAAIPGLWVKSPRDN